ncbi:Uncharacterised protein [Streptococcus pyogenes]|nr:Uncharacterised protein [Streptococcus pyogenes]
MKTKIKTLFKASNPLLGPTRNNFANDTASKGRGGADPEPS